MIEWSGRKSLLVWGFGMMVFWCIGLTVILNVLFIDGVAVSIDR